MLGLAGKKSVIVLKEVLMSAKSTKRILAFVAAGLVLASPAMAVDEDNGAPGNASPDAMSQIAAMTVPAVTLNFGLMPGGATTVAAIQAQFPDAGITDIVFSACTGAQPGTYDTNPSTRALAADPSGSLGLFLVDPQGAFGCFDDITITFSGPITQFGAQIADWNGPMNFNVYDGASNVGSIQLDTTSSPLQFVESTVPFDSLVITAFPDFPVANYVFPNLVFPEVIAQPTPTPTPVEEAVPTLGSGGIVLLVILIAGIGVIVMRRLF